MGEHWPRSRSRSDAPAPIERSAGDDEAARVREMVARAVGSLGSPLFLVIDQFEELFTLAEKSSREVFLAVLADCVAERSVRTVVTIRADYFDRPLADHRLGAWMRSATTFVTALSPEQLAEVIVEPARSVGVTVEPALVAALVADAAGVAAPLPMLQVAMQQLFEQRSSDTMSVERVSSTRRTRRRNRSPRLRRPTPYWTLTSAPSRGWYSTGS